MRTLIPLTARTYASASFIPASSLYDIEAASNEDPRPKPSTPTFYTGRAEFYDALRALEDAHKAVETSLRAVRLLPFPASARAHLPPPDLAWKRRDGIGAMLGVALTIPRHRHIMGLLTQMNELRRIAVAGGEREIATHLSGILALFEREDKEAHLARHHHNVAPLDEHGRTYTRGKRKESAARVWMIAAREPADGTIPTTSILVNNRPLVAYFPNPLDRQRVVRPFKLAGLLGAFNVFSLVRGGGTSGQAGALAHGIAKGLVSHVPGVALILQRSKLIRRDPRMVERKKTGLAKARKRYTWVKR